MFKRFYSYIYGLYLQFLLWHDKVSNSSENRYINPVTPQIIRHANQLKYEEGILNIKRKVNQLIKAPSKQEYEKVLGEVNELMNLAENESEELKKMAEALKVAYVKTDKDVKSSLDKAKMIDYKISNIGKYYNAKDERDLLRKIRQAFTEGNVAEYDKLKLEWAAKYGRKHKKNNYGEYYSGK